MSEIEEEPDVLSEEEQISGEEEEDAGSLSENESSLENEEEEEEKAPIVVKKTIPPKPMTKKMFTSGLSRLIEGPSGEVSFSRLDVVGEGVTSAEIIQEMRPTNLEYICVRNNKLTKLNDLEVLPRLIAVDAAKNKITDAYWPPSIYLEHLDLSRNIITSASNLSHPNLTRLNLNRNSKPAMRLEGLLSLKTLEARKCKLVSCEDISSPCVEEVYLNQNEISSLDGLQLSKCRTLSLRGNPLETIPDNFVTACPSLEHINLRETAIMDILELVKLSPLTRLTSINTLDTPVSEDDDFMAMLLSYLPHLKTINKEVVDEDDREEGRIVAEERRQAEIEAEEERRLEEKERKREEEEERKRREEEEQEEEEEEDNEKEEEEEEQEESEEGSEGEED
eukprot:TRINITY_DN1226_c0_g1_i1.p1 TRINITY_DN1226_c0_g1~~TRINITY_DN1226_c0_g1_i1.p1  ORF type:complete len:394 (+),score=112.11 TRINITY_DN1226_c0_g1_i1:61-1242(+)